MRNGTKVRYSIGRHLKRDPEWAASSTVKRQLAEIIVTMGTMMALKRMLCRTILMMALMKWRGSDKRWPKKKLKLKSSMKSK